MSGCARKREFPGATCPASGGHDLRSQTDRRSTANITVRSNSCGPVMSKRNPPLNGSAAIQASYETLQCLPPETTAASMRSRRCPGTPLMSKTVIDIRHHCKRRRVPAPGGSWRLSAVGWTDRRGHLPSGGRRHERSANGSVLGLDRLNIHR